MAKMFYSLGIGKGYLDIMGLWLSDSGNMKAKENFAQCMANHWKMLKWSSVEDIIKANGILTSVSGVSTFKVCNNRVKLQYSGERRLKDIPPVVNKIKIQRASLFSRPLI